MGSKKKRSTQVPSSREVVDAFLRGYAKERAEEEALPIRFEFGEGVRMIPNDSAVDPPYLHQEVKKRSMRSQT